MLKYSFNSMLVPTGMHTLVAVIHTLVVAKSGECKVLSNVFYCYLFVCFISFSFLLFNDSLIFSVISYAIFLFQLSFSSTVEEEEREGKESKYDLSTTIGLPLFVFIISSSLLFFSFFLTKFNTHTRAKFFSMGIN